MKTTFKLVGMGLAAMAFLTACNTIEGAGKDVEVTGEEIQDTANDVEDELTD